MSLKNKKNQKIKPAVIITGKKKLLEKLNDGKISSRRNIFKEKEEQK